MATKTESALTVRVSGETLERVDAAVGRRRSKIPRHSWLLEAIYEKLDREERVEGDLEVVREREQGGEMPERYRLRFFRTDRRRRTPVAPLDVVGDDQLERCLVQWGITPDNAKGWIKKVKVDGRVSIANMKLPADHTGRYGFRVAGPGIHANLPGGKTALLFHDYPEDTPKEIRGDRLSIFSRSGGCEGEVTVTDDGRVLILEKHFWPPEAPGRVLVRAREASAAESKRFLQVHRLYVPD